MDEDKTVSAEMIKYLYTLYINANNGSVIIFPERETYNQGTFVRLQASPDDGYGFTRWEGDLSGTENPASIILDSDKSITAVFSEITNAFDRVGNTPPKSMLKQNYSNPFFVSTIIPYYLKDAAKVNLSIFNIHGEKVITLVDEHQQAGDHLVEWNAQNTKGNSPASGVYFYRLEIENHLIQTKMMIVSQ